MTNIVDFTKKKEEKAAKQNAIAMIRQRAYLQQVHWTAVARKEKVWVIDRLIEAMGEFSSRFRDQFWQTIFVSIHPLLLKADMQTIVGFKLVNSVDSALGDEVLTNCDNQEVFSVCQVALEHNYNMKNVNISTKHAVIQVLFDYTLLFEERESPLLLIPLLYLEQIAPFYRLTQYDWTNVDGVVSPLSMEFTALAKDHPAQTLTLIFDFNAIRAINKEILEKTVP